MLKPAAYPAKSFLANAQIRSNVAQWYPFRYMRHFEKQFFITFSGCFELGIYKPLLQPYIIFFIHNSYQSFNFMVLVI